MVTRELWRFSALDDLLPPSSLVCAGLLVSRAIAAIAKGRRRLNPGRIADVCVNAEAEADEVLCMAKPFGDVGVFCIL